MTSAKPVSDSWQVGSPYERYIGRWSRCVAPLFLAWLAVPLGKRWVDVGCGTGVLSAAVLDACSPSSVTGVEPSDGFREFAVQSLGDRSRFLAGNAARLPLDDESCDAVVSGLVLNFIPDLTSALAEMLRVTSPGGVVAAYVWDYAGQMQVIKAFWDVAVSLDPNASSLDEGSRFPLCNETALRAAFRAAGLEDVETAPLDMTAQFVDFEDYWQPFLGGQGPAPAYLGSLTEEQRSSLRSKLLASLPGAAAQGFSLQARALAVRGVKRGRPFTS